MDNDYSIDMRALAQTIATNDVITMRFITVGHRLLLDFRSTELDGPMIRVVDPVQSVRERYESLRQLRGATKPLIKRQVPNTCRTTVFAVSM